MNQHISIRNFGPIRLAEIDVNDLTVLIGEQASGKSTIAKLVYFFKSLRGDLVEMSRNRLQDLTGGSIVNRVRDKFYLYFGGTKQLLPDYCIIFSYDNDKQVMFQGSPLNVQFLPREPSGWFYQIEMAVRRSAPAVNRYREQFDFSAAEHEEMLLSQALAGIFNDSAEAAYIPAGRNITVAYSDDFLRIFAEEVKVRTQPTLGPDDEPKRNDAREIDLILVRDFITHSSRVRQEFKGIGIDGVLRQMLDRKLSIFLQKEVATILKSHYKFSNNIGEYLLLENSSRVLLRHASSGQQEVIRILQDVVLAIVDERPVFRVIEEPEAHLFPTAQQHLMQILASLLSNSHKAASGGDSRLFITTHSPYLLTILNNLIFAGDLNAEGASDADLLSTRIPAFSRLRPAQVSAYMIRDGLVEPINDTADGNFTDEATGLIRENLLEDVWNSLQQQFDALLEIGN